MTLPIAPSAWDLDQEEGIPSQGTRNRFVARSPILMPDKKIYGYELLYRDGLDACFAPSDPPTGNASNVDFSVRMGFDVLCNGAKVFLPCSLDVLLNEYVLLLPPQQTVVELVVGVLPGPAELDACKRLKQAGYMIALQRFTPEDPREPFVALADIIKVDSRRWGAEKCSALRQKYGPHCHLLAEHLESQEDFESAKKMHFSYFQGSFFRKPEVLPVSRVSVNRSKYFRMLQAASRPELDLHELEQLIQSEPSATYRLLRYLNSSLFNFAIPINSVAQALTMLGTRETRQWVRLTAALCAGESKPSVLLLLALTRARLCELIGPQILAGEPDFFLLGILSLMDLIIDLPMPRVLEGLPISQEFKLTLLGAETRLQPVFHLMLALEAGDWPAVSALAQKYHLKESSPANANWHAMDWAQNLMKD